MSSQKGNLQRKRPQKHKNSTVYKNNLYGTTPKAKVVQNIDVSNVCCRCKDIIDWKIKYNKYKPLRAPTKCTKCDEKTVKMAYLTMCLPCAAKLEVCAKCGLKSENIVSATPSSIDIAQQDSEFQHILKSLPERKRRTFLRHIAKKEESTGTESSATDGKTAKEVLKEMASKVATGTSDDLSDMYLEDSDDGEFEDDS